MVSHLAAETPANQHAGAGASDSISLSRLPLLDRDVDLYPGERNTHSIKPANFHYMRTLVGVL